VQEDLFRFWVVLVHCRAAQDVDKGRDRLKLAEGDFGLLRVRNVGQRTQGLVLDVLIRRAQEFHEVGQDAFFFTLLLPEICVIANCH